MLSKNRKCSHDLKIAYEVKGQCVLFFSANGLKYHKERTKCEEPDSWTLELDHGQ